MTRVHIITVASIWKTRSPCPAAGGLLPLQRPVPALPRPEGLDEFLALDFNDIPQPLDGLQAVTGEQIERLISLHSRLERRRATGAAMLDGCKPFDGCGVDCGSSHAAQRHPPTLVAMLRVAAPHATPNPLMIALGDKQLGYHGALAHAVKKAARGAFITDAPPRCSTLRMT